MLTRTGGGGGGGGVRGRVMYETERGYRANINRSEWH